MILFFFEKFDLLNVSIFADNIFNSEKMTDTKPKLKKKQLDECFSKKFIGKTKE